MIADGIAQYLHMLGVVNYDELEGDCTLFVVRDQPAALVTLTPTGGESPDMVNPWDDPGLQVRVRGEPGAWSSTFGRAYNLYGRLHGLTNLRLPDGTWLISCTATSSGPVYMGADNKGRPEFVLNFNVSTAAETAHRKE